MRSNGVVVCPWPSRIGESGFFVALVAFFLISERSVIVHTAVCTVPNIPHLKHVWQARIPEPRKAKRPSHPPIPEKSAEISPSPSFKPTILDPDIPRAQPPPSLYQSTPVTKMFQADSAPRIAELAQNKPAQKPAPERGESDCKLLRRKTRQT